MKLWAYAKINLGLRVLGRREGGYHEIQSLMQTIDLADQLILEQGGVGIELDVEPCLGGSSQENLVYRAAELISKTAGSVPDLRLKLSKKIPVGAGLGGGSSDAAATLAGVNRLLELNLNHGRLRALAAELGSDVPFFLEGGSCLVSGRGEILKKLPTLPRYPLVLLLPPFSLSTAAVFGEFDRLRESGETIEEESPAFLRNDLEPAALSLHPELSRHRGFLRDAKPDFFGMSGSGPAWFGGFKEERRAEAVAREAAKLPGKVIVTGLVEHGYAIE
jgi:4-diphosphocytidyl-2-C-methyl-D-erythritol kinase